MDQRDSPCRSVSSLSNLTSLSTPSKLACRQCRITRKRLGALFEQTFDCASFSRTSISSNWSTRSIASDMSSNISSRSKPTSARRLFDESFDDIGDTLINQSTEGATTNGDISFSSTHSRGSISSNSTCSTFIEREKIVEKRRTIVTSGFSSTSLWLLNQIDKLEEVVDDIISSSQNLFIQVDKMMSPIVLIIFLSLIFSGAIVINTIQPVPFIDEIFHVRQARQYCRGNFSHWDSKITTPPGLYLVSLFLLRPLHSISNITSCSLFHLRATNIVFTIGNNLILFLYYRCINSKTCSITSSAIFDSISTTLFPPLFFFSFLYYTDPGSFFFLLLTFYFALAKKQYWRSSIVGAISLFFRQTNIIWIFFCAIVGLLKIGENEAIKHHGGHLAFLWRLGLSVLVKEGGYLLNGIGFIAFLYLNNGIVLGDRTAHQPGFHLAQLPYFLLFTTIFGAPHLFTRENVYYFWHLAKKRIYLLASLTSILVASLGHQFTYVHPYLLADNRHYTFYLWRRLLSNPNALWLRYSIVPVCLFTLCSIWKMINFTPEIKGGFGWKNLFLKYLFFFSTLLTIVPQQLIEFRYFIVPFLVWRMNIKSRNKFRLYLEFIYYLGLNLVTIYIFSVKTFYHPNSTLVQRIIW